MHFLLDCRLFAGFIQMHILSKIGSGEDQLLSNSWKPPEPFLNLKACILLRLKLEIHSFPVFSLTGEYQYLWSDQIQQDIGCSPRSLSNMLANNFYFQELRTVSLKWTNGFSWNSTVLWAICFPGTSKSLFFSSLLLFDSILLAAEKYFVSWEFSGRIWRQFALSWLLFWI